MLNVVCQNCKSRFQVPDGYEEPYYKCPDCGALQSLEKYLPKGPKYRILDSRRQDAKKAVEPDTNFPEGESAQIEEPKGPPKPKVARASAAAKARVLTSRPSSGPKGTSVIKERQILLDALGEDGLQMVFQMVAGYLLEPDKAAKTAKKNRVIQTLMRSKMTGEMAARAAAYAEKSPDTIELLKAEYVWGLKLGLGVFVVGMIISAFVYMVADPGFGFVIFQLPTAVGLAYAFHSLINLAGIKIDYLRSNMVHYGFIAIATILILLYAIAGVFY